MYHTFSKQAIMRKIIFNKYTETYGNITHTLRHNFCSRSSITLVRPELYTAEPVLFFNLQNDRNHL